MTDFIPLFPLKLVVFPYEELNLHIFESRYKQLIRECEMNHITFGIPAFLNDKVMEFGTEIELVKITKKNKNGSMDIKTRGIGIFKIHDFYNTAHNKMYAGGDIERVTGKEERDFDLNDKIIKRLNELYNYLKIGKPIPSDIEDFYTYEFAHHVGFSIHQEYQFLTIADENKRQEFMLDHLTNLLPVVQEMEKLKKKVEMNGHFKNIIPPK